VTEPAVLTERRDDVVVITINRPEARNCVNGAVSIGVGDALDRRSTTPTYGRW
jgi:crotonobetainyl-CoA hydratase